MSAGEIDGDKGSPNAAEPRRRSGKIACVSETIETEELAVITTGESKFENRIAKGEGGKWKDDLMTLRARSRSGYGVDRGRMRGSSYYGHVNDQSPKTGGAT